MNASFEEKSIWIQLIATVAGLGAYFAVAAWLLANGVTALPAYVPLFIGAVVVIVILIVFGHLLATLSGRAEGRDERDRMVGWKAENDSGWVLAVGVFGAITGLIFALESVWIVHILLVSLFLSEVLGFILRLVYYRRGI